MSEAPLSEATIVPPLEEAPAKRIPTVYFIDDSATMREVIKIAFRRENINVITCADAASALAQFELTRPDVVITDVIMPDQDGYSVCSQIKDNPDLSATPVVLMSGVVNKSVADKAVSVKADELIRKPFQPQELINRVKGLLQPKTEATPTSPFGAAERTAATNALSNLFAPVPAAPRPAAPPTAPPANAEAAWPRALAEAFTPRPAAPANLEAHPSASAPFNLSGFPPASANSHASEHSHAPSLPRPAPSAADLQKLRIEIARLELLVKKLQTELQIERQYNQALETQIKTLTAFE